MNERHGNQRDSSKSRRNHYSKHFERVPVTTIALQFSDLLPCHDAQHLVLYLRKRPPFQMTNGKISCRASEVVDMQHKETFESR